MSVVSHWLQVKMKIMTCDFVVGEKTSLGDDLLAPRLGGLMDQGLSQPSWVASSIVQLWPTKLCVPIVVVAMLPLLAGVRPLMSVAMSFGVIFLFPFFVIG